MNKVIVASPGSDNFLKVTNNVAQYINCKTW